MFAMGAAALLGSGNFLGGRAARSGIPSTGVAFVSHALGVVCLAIVVLVSGAHLPGPETLPLAVGGGVASALATVLLYRSLRLGLMAVNAPVVGVTSIVTATVAGAMQGDTLTPLGIAGIILAVVAVAATSQSSGATRASLALGGLPEAVGAGLGFGIFSVCLAASPDGAAATLFVARAVSAGVLLLIIARSIPSLEKLKVLASGAAVGAFEFTGNILMFGALAAGTLAIVQTLLSLNPVVTILLARSIYHEHLTRWQQAGSALALAAIILLAAS